MGTASIRVRGRRLRAVSAPRFCTGCPQSFDRCARTSRRSPRPFSRDLRSRARMGVEGAEHVQAALVYSPPPGAPGPLYSPPRNPTRSRSTTPVHPALEHTWSQIQAELRRAVTDSTYHLWLAPLRARAIEGDVLLVGAPEEIRTWVADRFQRVLQTCTAVVLGETAT